MTPLHWQETAQKGDGSSPLSSAGSSINNPWFALSVGLMGLIVGFGLGKWRTGSFPVAAGTPPAQVAQAPAPPAPAPPADPAGPDDDAMLGSKDAPVTLIEFVDYQCPFCKRFFDQTFAQLKTEYVDTGKVKLVMRDFPLSFHPNAQKAAEATECAQDGGKFWEMHDLLFAKQDEWASAPDGAGLFRKYATGLVLPKTFDSCLDTGKYAQEVKDDLRDGTTAGISGTPGFWIVGKDGNGEQISGAVPFSNFKTVIDTLLGVDAAAAPVPSADARTIKMTAELWKFTPTVVRVKQGEKVMLAITGVSGTHGLSVPGLGINETIIQGNTVSVAIPTDKTGTFDFRCSVQCGSGHNDMTGQIIVEAQ
ncbi:thioredoxin domain-containing protein [Candidatus Uhrbacteria bacterium]|nr:thioredoxin domain-containing protein [Candidatus Uhrbacteria bacterium]